MTPEQWTLFGMVAAIASAGLAKLWVWGWTFFDMQKDRDFWRDTALKSMGHVDKALGGKGE